MSLEVVLKEASDLVKEGIKKAKDALKPGLRDFLKDNQTIKAIRWSQYSPHFNDGEPCVFHFNGLHAFFGEGKVPPGDADSDREDEDGNPVEEQADWWVDVNYCYNDQIKAKFKSELKVLAELDELLKSNESALEALFGDGYQITVTKKGVSVEEYEHD